MIQKKLLFLIIKIEKIGFFSKKAYNLTDEQQNSVVDYEKQIYELINQTHPDGPEFAEVVRKILKRETYWSEWKNQGCEDFTQRKEKDKMALFRRRQKQKPKEGQ